MGLNGLLGSNDGFSSNFGGVAAAGVWMIVSVILAIIGGIVLYFVVFTKQNEHKFTGTCHCDCAVFRYPACHCSWITEEANTGMERKTTGRMETKTGKSAGR